MKKIFITVILTGIFTCVNINATEFEEKCNSGEALYCGAVAMNYLKGENGYEQNVDKGELFLNKACNLKNMDMCGILGSYYGRKKQYPEAITAFEKACNLGSTERCYTLGKIYSGGSIGPKSITKAIEYYTKACEKDNINACYDLSLIYWEGGDDVVRNPSKSITLMDKACSLGDKQACSSSKLFSRANKYTNDKKELGNVIRDMLDIIDNK